MSGSVIYTPSTGADWATAWEQAEYARKGKMGISLTNYEYTTLCAIASGSWAEVAGSIYKWTGEEAISGSLTTGAINYIKLVPSGSGDTAIVTATWTDSAPAWSDAYQGWYDGTSRYVGGCWYTGSLYANKFLLHTANSMPETFYISVPPPEFEIYTVPSGGTYGFAADGSYFSGSATTATGSLIAVAPLILPRNGFIDEYKWYGRGPQGTGNETHCDLVSKINSASAWSDVITSLLDSQTPAETTADCDVFVADSTHYALRVEIEDPDATSVGNDGQFQGCILKCIDFRP